MIERLNIFFASDNTVVYLICQHAFTYIQKSNIERHYLTNHSDSFQKLDGKDRQKKLEELKLNLEYQRRKLKMSKEFNFLPENPSFNNIVIIFIYIDR